MLVGLRSAYTTLLWVMFAPLMRGIKTAVRAWHSAESLLCSSLSRTTLFFLPSLSLHLQAISLLFEKEHLAGLCMSPQQKKLITQEKV